MRKNIQILTLVATVFADYIGFSLVIAIFPPILLHNNPPFLAAGTSEFWRNTILGLLTAAYPVSQFFGAPIFGSLSDQYGRKKIMQITLLGSSLSYVASAIAMLLPSITLLFASRILAGLFAGNLTLAQAGIGDLSTSETRTKNFSYVSSAGALAFVIGPILGGRIADWFNIAAPFYVAAGLFVIVLLVFRRVFAESNRPRAITTRFSLLSGFNNIKNMTRLPQLHRPLISFFIIRTGYWIFLFFFSAYLVEKFNFSRTQSADAYVVIAVWTLVILNTVVKWASKLLTTRQLIVITGVILSISILVIGLVSNPAIVYWVIPFWTFGASGFYTYFLSYLSIEAGSEHQGLAMGVAMSLQSVAQIVAPILAGLIMSTHVSLPLLLSAFVVMLGACVLFGFFKKTSLH